jgi:hypothetical protein
LFEEMMEQELMQKRVEFIQSMKESMIDMDVEGNEIKFFSSKFLVSKYLKLSDADLKLNDKLKQVEIEELNLAGDPDNPAGAEEGTGGGFGGFEGLDYDKLASMVVEKLMNKTDLITEISQNPSKEDKEVEKKKKPVKSKKKKENKEEE